MSESLSLYLSMQILLSLVLLLVWVIKNNFILINYSSLLKLSYVLIFASVLIPVILSMTPGENPFGPIAKVWSEGVEARQAALMGGSVKVHLPSTALTQSVIWDVPGAVGLIFLIGIGFFMLRRLMRLLTSYVELRRMLTSSILLKRVKRTKVWLNPNVQAPFSFFNGSAHVVLPYKALEDRQCYKIALSHELQHHRQKDTVWIYFIELVSIVFAVNPLVKKLEEQVMEVQELACDEALVGHKSYSPHAYGKCLFDFAEQQLSTLHSPVGAIGMAAETQFLKRRIQVMFKQQRTTSKRALSIILIGAVLAMTGAAWAARGSVSDQKITFSQAQVLANKANVDQQIPIVVDSRVLHFLNKAVGTEKSRKHMRESLQRMKLYKAMIIEQLEAASFPKELLAVPLVESGYRNDLVSSMQAAGIWQFIPDTARSSGLVVNEELDERLNPSRLTEAAVYYYQQLHAIFQNWHVALVAYGIGENRMLKVIAEARHNDVLKLAREGKFGKWGGNYFPKLMAAMIILKNPELVQ